MTGRYLKKFAALGAGCALALTAASAANADTYSVSSASSNWMVPGEYQTGGIHSTNPVVNDGNVYIGPISLTIKDDTTGSSSDWTSFCVDIAHNLTAGSDWTESLLTSSSSAQGLPSGGLGVDRTNQLINLLAKSTDYIGTGAGASDRGAAVQLAIWELVNETSGTYSISNGSFTADNITAAALSDTATLLSTLSTTANTGIVVKLVQKSGDQTQVIFSNASGGTAAVPEPATWGLMVVGFGAIGGALRRKSKPTSVTA